MITISNNNITANAAIRVHSTMSGNQTDSVKYLVKFTNNDLANVVTPVVADGNSDKVAEITGTFSELIVPTPRDPATLLLPPHHRHQGGTRPRAVPRPSTRAWVSTP